MMVISLTPTSTNNLIDVIKKPRKVFVCLLTWHTEKSFWFWGELVFLQQWVSQELSSDSGAMLPPWGSYKLSKLDTLSKRYILNIFMLLCLFL